jgi:hypothetical protein
MIKADFMEEEKKPLLRYNMQFFADKGDGDGADNTGDGGDDNQDDDGDDKAAGNKSKKSDKTFTQAELDEAIKLRLKREREKAKKAEQTEKDKQDNKSSDDKSKDESDKKLSALEEKVLCYDHDIAKEYVKEAIALAKAYVDEDTDMDEALEKVTKKFPQFVKGAGKKKDSDGSEEDESDEDETDNKKSWGQRQKGQSKKTDAVEAAFLKRNPGLKLD